MNERWNTINSSWVCLTTGQRMCPTKSQNTSYDPTGCATQGMVLPLCVCMCAALLKVTTLTDNCRDLLSHARQVYAVRPPFSHKLARTIFLLADVVAVEDGAERGNDLRREALSMYRSLNGGDVRPDSDITLEDFDAMVVYSSR